MLNTEALSAAQPVVSLSLVSPRAARTGEGGPVLKVKEPVHSLIPRGHPLSRPNDLSALPKYSGVLSGTATCATRERNTRSCLG